MLVTVLRSNLVHNLDTTLTQQAVDRAALLDGGSAPADLVTLQQAEAFAWIGTVRRGRAGRRRQPAAARGPAPGRTRRHRDGPGAGRGERTRRARPSSRRWRTTTCAWPPPAAGPGTWSSWRPSSSRSIERSTSCAGSWSSARPVLVSLVAVLAWFSVGRALSPVERIRNRAARISGTQRRGPGTGAGRPRRDPRPGRDDERHARPPRRAPAIDPTLHRGRQPRAEEPDGQHPGAGRDQRPRHRRLAEPAGPPRGRVRPRRRPGRRPAVPGRPGRRRSTTARAHDRAPRRHRLRRGRTGGRGRRASRSTSTG